MNWKKSLLWHFSVWLGSGLVLAFLNLRLYNGCWRHALRHLNAFWLFSQHGTSKSERLTMQICRFRLKTRKIGPSSKPRSEDLDVFLLNRILQEPERAHLNALKRFNTWHGEEFKEGYMPTVKKPAQCFHCSSQLSLAALNILSLHVLKCKGPKFRRH